MIIKPALLIIVFICISAANTMAWNTANADTLVQPDTTVIKQDTSSSDDLSIRETVAEDFGNRLKSQLNLTDEQTSKIKSIIAAYIDNYGSEGSASPPNGQIEALLDEVQRGSWQSVKDGFWSDLNRRIQDEDE